MATLSIDFGLRSFDIVDPSGNTVGQLRFNPADPGLATRWDDAHKAIKAQLSVSYAEVEDIRKLDNFIKERIDYALGTEASRVLFPGVSALALCADGTFVVEHVLEALAPLMESAMEEAGKAAKARMSQHTSKYEGSTLGLAPEQQ